MMTIRRSFEAQKWTSHALDPLIACDF
ncbi:uncharacterized protein METZ01_LOCUS374184 [marine metagenome]|uniref:Uncharacterized protein n=1 Tax=marine metagenome TaxID=408172 RepID=A0A382TGU4_9ZZZZ